MTKEEKIARIPLTALQTEYVLAHRARAEFDRTNPSASREERLPYIEAERAAFLAAANADIEAAGGEDAILGKLL